MKSRVCPGCGATWYSADETGTLTCFWCETDIPPRRENNWTKSNAPSAVPTTKNTLFGVFGAGQILKGLTMKALSVWQPHASLIALRSKKIETRGWYTNYRGPLVIHAAKTFPKFARDLCGDDPFTFELVKGGYMGPDTLPLGAVVAYGNLAECCLIKEDGLYRLIPGLKDPPKWFEPLPAEPEISFGDYTPGRFAWILEEVQMLPEPIPAKGHQGLWNWEPPEGVQLVG